LQVSVEIRPPQPAPFPTRRFSGKHRGLPLWKPLNQTNRGRPRHAPPHLRLTRPRHIHRPRRPRTQGHKPGPDQQPSHPGVSRGKTDPWCTCCGAMGTSRGTVSRRVWPTSTLGAGPPPSCCASAGTPIPGEAGGWGVEEDIWGAHPWWRQLRPGDHRPDYD